ncbi:DNA methyltransferase [Shewanella baltica]|nr:site-specific DNA-methyltransferase [Shewanella baltica]
MLPIINALTNVLQADDRLVIDGKLAKNKIVELALNLDPALLKLLLSDEKLRNHFFQDVDCTLIFDKIAFQRFVNNKSFLSDSFTQFKNKIGLSVEQHYLAESNDVVLSWPYKDCFLEGGQTKEEQKRIEIFWNETLAPEQVDTLLEPKALTKFTKFVQGSEVNEFDLNSDDNLIIRGNNLLALHSLKKKYAGKIKLIYIDPPYNTGSDSFGYNDNFNHSTWLTFMKNRLSCAKELLSPDGFICCHIDDNESAYLRVLMDEVFGRDNFLTTFNIRVRYAEKTLKQDMNFHKEIEYVHIYQRSPASKPNLATKDNSIEKYIYYFQELTDGTEMTLGGKKVILFNKGEYKIVKKEASENGRKEVWASGTILDGNSSGRYFRDFLTGRYDVDGYGAVYKVFGVGEEGNGYRYFSGPNKEGATKGKYYQSIPSSKKEGSTSTLPISNFYDFAGSFGNCRTEGGVELRSGKKPEKFLKVIINHFSNPEDIVLDYHLGCGSTAATALKLGRKFIGIEQLNYQENDPIIRLKNVVNGDSTGISKDVNWQGYCATITLTGSATIRMAG